jgi:hypothetical protein
MCTTCLTHVIILDFVLVCLLHSLCIGDRVTVNVETYKVSYTVFKALYPRILSFDFTFKVKNVTKNNTWRCGCMDLNSNYGVKNKSGVIK